SRSRNLGKILRWIIMSFTQVGSCPECGAPVDQQSLWMGVLPPPSYYSCNCSRHHRTRYIEDTKLDYDPDIMVKRIETSEKIKINEALKRYKQNVPRKEESTFETVIEWLTNSAFKHEKAKDKSE